MNADKFVPQQTRKRYISYRLSVIGLFTRLLAKIAIERKGTTDKHR